MGPGAQSLRENGGQSIGLDKREGGRRALSQEEQISVFKYGRVCLWMQSMLDLMRVACASPGTQQPRTVQGKQG